MNQLEPLVASYGRPVNYLRISLTEICNFKCVYCEPPQGAVAKPTKQHLSLDELERFVSIAARLGISKIRLTGGEPLLRPDIVEIVRRIRRIPGVRDLSLTTNASKLTPLLRPLKEAGLDRMNISLDSLNPSRFEQVTRSQQFKIVYQSVFQSLEMGFGVKLNMVVLKGIEQKEIIQFVELARDYPFEVRFLEFMPLCGSSWDANDVVPIQDIRMIVQENFILRELPRGDNPAQSFSIQNGKGKVGFIASLTESFCATCSRMRLSVDGSLFPCLFSGENVSIKKLLRESASDEKLIEAIRLAANIKPKGNDFYTKPFNLSNNYENQKKNPYIKTIGG